MNTEISGKITIKDYLQFALYQWRYSFLLVWVLLIIFISLIFPVETAPLVTNIFYYGFLPIPYLFLFFMVILIRERREYKSLDNRFHERVININEEKIFYGIREKQRDIQWNDTKKAVYFKRFIILYTRSKQPLLIPKHFFSSLEEEREWIDFIKRHLPN